MKTALAAVGGALAMLVAVAASQARTSAAQLQQNPSPTPYAVEGTPTGVPSNMTAAYQPAVWRPTGYAGYSAPPSDLVQLESVRAVPVRYVSREPLQRRSQYRDSRHRNWAKAALVIGGSAGAGAGVGALAGGKKGALVGAALGGGVASLFEALR